MELLRGTFQAVTVQRWLTWSELAASVITSNFIYNRYNKIQLHPFVYASVWMKGTTNVIWQKDFPFNLREANMQPILNWQKKWLRRRSAQSKSAFIAVSSGITEGKHAPCSSCHGVIFVDLLKGAVVKRKRRRGLWREERPRAKGQSWAEVTISSLSCCYSVCDIVSWEKLLLETVGGFVLMQIHANKHYIMRSILKEA